MEEFVEYTYSQSRIFDKIRCPSYKCGNKEFHMQDDVKHSFYGKGMYKVNSAIS